MATRGKSTVMDRHSVGDGDLLRLYLNEIGRHELLSRDDEQRLGRVIDAGRRAARALSVEEDELPEESRARLRAEVAAGDRAARTFV